MAFGAYASQGYGGASGGPSGGFSEQEAEHYQSLFRQADKPGRGSIDGSAGAEFLRATGLPEDQLHRVWEIADADNQGALDANRFFVACRLVAHAQAGQSPTPYLASIEPRLLPEFQGVRRLRQPSETSSRGGSPSPSALGGAVAASDVSELQPVIAGGEEQVRRAAQAARQASRSPARRAFTQDQWAPTQREKRKYATLFKRVDWDCDGYVLGHEARDLLARSGLSAELLQTCWDLADMDRDGRLSFTEFVCMVHTVTCALRGARIPPPHEGSAQELLHALTNLESAQALLAEREASRSRSTSPAPSGLLSAAGEAWSPPRWSPGTGTANGGAAAAAAGAGARAVAGAEGLGTADPQAALATFGSSQKADALDAAAAAFGDFDLADAFGDGLGEGRRGKSKDKKKRRPSEDPFASEAGATADFGGSGHGGRIDAASSQELFNGGAGGASQKSRDSSGRRGRDFFGTAEAAGRRNQEQLVATTAQFDSTIAADREVSRQLRREVEELHDELCHLDEVRRQVEDQLRQDRQIQEARATEAAALEQRLESARRRLQDVRERKRALNLESLSLRRDRTHCEEELAFLRQMADDEAVSYDAARQANVMLENSYRELETHTETLEKQRRGLVLQVQQEQDLVRQEERSTASMRNKLEQARRQQASSELERQEVLRRFERTRELQGLGRPVVVGSGVVEPPAGHSWAHSISVAKPMAPAVSAS